MPMDKLDTATFAEEYELMLEHVICGEPELLYLDALLTEAFGK